MFTMINNPEDIWSLCLYLKKILPKHNFFMRQHYFNSFDLVLYAVPSNVTNDEH